MTYEPIFNDRRDFDPLAPEWSYMLDLPGVGYLHPLTPPALRTGYWPFCPAGQEYVPHAVRLAPDWCYYAWGTEYVLAAPVRDDPHRAEAHAYISGGAPPHETYRHGGCTITLNLLAMRWAVRWAASAVVTPAREAEVAAKAPKLLAYLRGEADYRDMQVAAKLAAVPVQAYTVYSARVCSLCGSRRPCRTRNSLETMPV